MARAPRGATGYYYYFIKFNFIFASQHDPLASLSRQALRTVRGNKHSAQCGGARVNVAGPDSIEGVVSAAREFGGTKKKLVSVIRTFKVTVL